MIGFDAVVGRRADRRSPRRKRKKAEAVFDQQDGRGAGAPPSRSVVRVASARRPRHGIENEETRGHGRPSPSSQRRKGGTCPECDVGPFARQRRIGPAKLMLARDFVDEQTLFHREASPPQPDLARFGGWVCGLKIVQHEKRRTAARALSSASRPGTALDCCGHDIVPGARRTASTFSPCPRSGALKDKEKREGARPSKCASPSGNVRPRRFPVLFDECGCDEDRCAPNRILESYDLHVHVLDQEPADDPAPPADCCEILTKPLDGCPHCDRARLHHPGHRGGIRRRQSDRRRAARRPLPAEGGRRYRQSEASALLAER